MELTPGGSPAGFGDKQAVCCEAWVKRIFKVRSWDVTASSLQLLGYLWGHMVPPGRNIRLFFSFLSAYHQC